MPSAFAGVFGDRKFRAENDGKIAWLENGSGPKQETVVCRPLFVADPSFFDVGLLFDPSFSTQSPRIFNAPLPHFHRAK